MQNVVNVAAHGFTDSHNGIDERDFHSQEGVGGVFNEFGALCRSFNIQRRYLRARRFGDGARASGVTGVGQWTIQVAQSARGAFAIDAYYDPLGIQEIRDRRSFPHELGIGRHVKLVPATAIENHGAPYPGVPVNRYRALLHDQLVVINRARNFPGHGIDIGKIGFTVGSRWGPYRNHDD